MKNVLRVIGLSVLFILFGADAAFAEEAAGKDGLAAIGSGLAIGLAVLGSGTAQGKAVAAGLDAIGRNPSASGKLFTPMILGLVFVESLVIFALAISFVKF